MSTTTQDYSEYLKQLNDAKKRKSAAALQSAYESSLAAINRSGATVDGDYRQARNTAAAQSAQEGKNFNEYAAANGLNSGTAGQAALARSVTLQNNLNALERDKAAAKADLETQRSDARSQYQSQLAQIEAEWDADLAQSLYEEKVRQAEQSQWQQELDFAIQKYWNDLGLPVPGTESAASSGGSTGTATLTELARQVIHGDWGNGAERKRRLTAAGYDYNAVQSLVDQMLK